MALNKPWLFQDQDFIPSSATTTDLTYHVIATFGDFAVAALHSDIPEELAPKVPNPIGILTDPNRDEVRVGDQVEVCDLWHMVSRPFQSATDFFQAFQGLPTFSELAQFFTICHTAPRNDPVLGLVIQPPANCDDEMLLMGPRMSEPLPLAGIFWPRTPPTNRDSLWWVQIISSNIPEDSTIVQVDGHVTTCIPRKMAVKYCEKGETFQAANPDDSQIFVSRIILEDRRKIHDAFPNEPLLLHRLQDTAVSAFRRQALLPPLRLKQFLLNNPSPTFKIAAQLVDNSTSGPLLEIVIHPKDFAHHMASLEAGKLLEITSTDGSRAVLYVTQATSPHLITTIHRSFMPRSLQAKLGPLQPQSTKPAWKQVDEEELRQVYRSFRGKTFFLQPSSARQDKHSDETKTMTVLFQPQNSQHEFWTPHSNKPLSLCVAANLVYPGPPVAPESIVNPELSPDLNRQQQEAIRAFLQPHSAVVVKAAAGTGKSHAIAHACLHLRKLNPSGTIVVAGNSNDCVANLEEALLRSGVEPHEILILASATAKLRSQPQNRNTNPSSAFSHLQRLQSIEPPLAAKVRRAFHEYQTYPPTVNSEALLAEAVLTRNPSLILVATTAMIIRVAGAIQAPVLGLLLDEAGQVTETELLTLFCSLPHSSPRMLLAGDPNQLACPVPPSLIRLQAIGLRSSLIKAQHHPQAKQINLALSFRFTERLAKAISHACYKGEVECAKQSAELEGFKDIEDCSENAPVVFKEVDGRETRVGKSFTNVAQVKMACECLHELCLKCPAIASGEGNVVILAPYNAAATEIRTNLPDVLSQYPQLRVRAASVDQYQGQEATVTIFVTTRTMTNYRRDFASFTPRVTVALTRARKGLIIIGHKAYLQERSPELRRLLRFCHL